MVQFISGVTPLIGAHWELLKKTTKQTKRQKNYCLPLVIYILLIESDLLNGNRRISWKCLRYKTRCTMSTYLTPKIFHCSTRETLSSLGVHGQVFEKTETEGNSCRNSMVFSLIFSDKSQHI